MLLSLEIKNFILINSAEISFKTQGLTVITGETGAGKSMLLNAILFVFGHKVFKSPLDVLHAKDKNAVVTAAFAGSAVDTVLKEHGFDMCDQIVLRRVMSAEGKSKIFLNDVVVTSKLLSLLQQNLFEMCGQNMAKELLCGNSPKNILDSYCNHYKCIKEIGNLCDLWNKLKCEFDDLDNTNIEIEKEFLHNSINEIENLSLQANEEDELLLKRESAKKYDKFINSFNSIYSCINDLNFESKAKVLHKELGKISELDCGFISELDLSISHFIEFQARLEDLIGGFDKASDLSAIEDRLFKIRSIARKNNVLSAQLSDLLEEKKLELKNLNNIDDIKLKIHKDMMNVKQEYIKLANLLSESRKNGAAILSVCINDHLKSLKMNGVEFIIHIITDMSGFAKDGVDKVMFMAKTSDEGELLEVAKVSSGGEMSRLLLALKIAISGDIESKTMIFDEIDTGISGSTSSAVGRKLKDLSLNRQVIVVTHQPQVAAFADTHIIVSKKDDGRIATSYVDVLNDSSRKIEIARLLSGDVITEESMNAAVSLCNEAGNSDAG